MANLTFFAPDTDPFVDSVKRHLAEYETRSGNAVRLSIISSDEYFSNQISPCLDETDAADVFMSGPVLLWEHIQNGHVEPLDPYVNRPEYAADFADFLPNLIHANRWTGRFGDPLGQGPLLGLPVNCESYNLAYPKRVLEELALKVPTTWEEFFQTARSIAEKDPSLSGFAQRGTGAWHTMYTGFATYFWTMGATDFAKDGTCAIASEKAIQITDAFLKALHQAGPKQWLSQRWYELALDFAKGKYGLIVDSDHYVGYFENKDISPLAGRIGYALPPVNADGTSRPNLWTWSIVMNEKSRNKEAAWSFIKWASSREFLLRSCFEGNMNPTRTSVWDDPAFVKEAENWGDYYRVSKQLAASDARVLVTPAPNYRELAEIWVSALLEAYQKGNTKEALEKAAWEIDRKLLR